MKNLKPILKSFSLILLLAFASCKKDSGVKPESNSNSPVTTADLLGYSINIALTSDLGLRIIYFNKDGNDIKATFDAVNIRRVFTVNLVNNTWTLDLNGNGTTIYTFTFAKKDDGDLVISNGTYKKQDDASVKFQAVISKNADIPAIANLRYRELANIPTYLKFSNDHNFAVSAQSDYAGAGWKSYYDLCPGAWKGNYNGVDYMGFCIPQADNKVEMFVQKAGESQYHVFEQL